MLNFSKSSEACIQILGFILQFLYTLICQLCHQNKYEYYHTSKDKS